jgi:hypothetical protein
MMRAAETKGIKTKKYSIFKESEMVKRKVKVLSSSRLKILRGDLRKADSAGRYLENEMRYLMKHKDKIRGMIRKEKEILKLKERIERVKNKKG